MGLPRSCGATAGHAHAHDMQMSPGKLPCAQHRPEAVRVPRTAQLRPYAYPVRPNCGPAVARRTCHHSPSGVDGLGAALDHDDPTVAKLAHADGEGEAAGPTADYHHIGFGIGRAHGSSAHLVSVHCGSYYSGCRNPAGFFKGANFTNHEDATGPICSTSAAT